MKKKIFLSPFLSILFLVSSATINIAGAHVVVNPNEVTLGTLQAFTLSVPNEKEQPVVALKLRIPHNLQDITPTVKSGWTITVNKTDQRVTSLEWSGGVIPVGQRDEFSFSARVPSRTVTLLWKTYQTFEDGTVIAWDREPKKQVEEEEDNSGPYSSTLVVDDQHKQEAKQPARSTLTDFALLLSLVSLIIAAASFLRSVKK